MFGKKRKDQSKLPQPYRSSGISTNATGVPPGFRAEMDHRDENPKRARITSWKNDSDDLGAPTPEIFLPDVGTDHNAESRNEAAEEYIGDVEMDVVSTVPEGGRPSSAPIALIDLTKNAEEGFGALRAALKTICAGSAGTKETVIRNEIENLLPRVATLGERFQTLPRDVEDQKRRQELIDKAKDIEGRLGSLHESQGLQYHTTDCSKDDEAVFRILEDLQGAIFDYQVANRMAIQEEECKQMGSDEATVLNNFRCVQGAEYRHGNRKGCLWGTRSGILGEIERWSGDFGGPSVYWLNGLAGTGKTTIAQTIAERLFADGWLGASFFCSRDFEDRSNLQFIFPALAVQLAHRYPEFRSILVPLVRSDSTITHESLWNQMKKLIVRPLTKSAVSTVIVIDALDECKDDEPASAILSVLGQFVSQIPNVKFFLTGRPEPRIREGFRLPLLVPATEVFVLHGVESSQVNSDIQQFFRRSFSELATRRGGLDGWPGERQLDLLCERAAGLFIYAVASVKFIEHKNSNPRRQLDRLLQAAGSGVFEGKTKFNADKTIDSLYLSILQEAFGDDDPEDDPKIRSILGAVVLATNPLSPSSIAVLLGLDAEDVLPPLSSAHSLLILHEGVDQPVRPFHKSFPDFITHPTRCADPRFRVCPAVHHTELVVGCLELLDQRLEQNICGLPDGVINSEVDDLKERIGRYIGRALEYACKSWHKHLPETAPARKPDITSALHRFLERKFLFWLEVLSILGAAREAVDALEAAGKWLDESPTLDLVVDCSRFVITFFDLINTSAPHIYHSAIILSPRKSNVRHLYESYARPLARVVRGLPMTWEAAAATAFVPQDITAVAWSPCGRFIAVGFDESDVVEILDAKTLGRIKTLACSPNRVKLLHFSPNGCLLTGFGSDSELTCWDFQTGGPVCAIPSELGFTYCRSSTYSTDGKMIAIARGSYSHPDIRTYNLISGKHIYTHQALKGCTVFSVWTHGEHLRFTVAESGSIAIWEAEFTSIHTLKKVETLPLPDKVSGGEIDLFHPTLYRIVFRFETAIMAWDARHSKFLLDFKTRCFSGNFSPDGRFLAYATHDGVYIWKESPTGYVLHRGPILAGAEDFTSFLSLYGESIIIYHWLTIHLSHTAAPLPSIPNKPVRRTDLILGFFIDKTLAVVAQASGNTVTIFDLQSGEPWFTIDAGTEVLGMRVTSSAVAVVVGGGVVTWGLPTGGRGRNARANAEDAVHTTPLGPIERHFLFTFTTPASISPDLSLVAVHNSSSITLYDMSTGRRLASGETTSSTVAIGVPWFTPDTREVWCGNRRLSHGWKIVEGNEPGFVKLDPVDLDASPPGGFPWESTYGYGVSDDGWVLSPCRRRHLWLPHNWRSNGSWLWEDRFLGLFQSTLPEAVILEFYE